MQTHQICLSQSLCLCSQSSRIQGCQNHSTTQYSYCVINIATSNFSFRLTSLGGGLVEVNSTIKQYILPCTITYGVREGMHVHLYGSQFWWWRYTPLVAVEDGTLLAPADSPLHKQHYIKQLLCSLHIVFVKETEQLVYGLEAYTSCSDSGWLWASIGVVCCRRSFYFSSRRGQDAPMAIAVQARTECSVLTSIAFIQVLALTLVH